MMEKLMFFLYTNPDAIDHAEPVCKTPNLVCISSIRRLAFHGVPYCMHGKVKADDFFDQMRQQNQVFRVLKSNVDGHQPLLTGSFTRQVIRKGLVLHYSDVTNLVDLKTESEASPHLGIKLFFRGGVSASIGNCEIPMPRRAGGADRWIASATLINQAEQELFRRNANAGDRVRKLSIKIFPEWLEAGGTFSHPDAQSLRAFTSLRLSARSWNPSAAFLALAEQAMRPPNLLPHLRNLYIESKVLGLVSEAFALLGSGPQLASLSAIEQRRLSRAEDLLKGHPNLSIEAIASELNTSVNTLQRLFQAVHGTTLFNYMKGLRLEKARIALADEGLTVGQAAHIAGYTSSANFATAFKKQFGFTPRDARQPGFPKR